MPSDQERSPSVQDTSLTSESGRRVAPSPQLQQTISNLNEHLVHPRASTAILQDSVPPTSPFITAMTTPSILPLTKIQARHIRNESNRTLQVSSPDIGNFELSIPPRGPLNHNITMGPRRQASGSSEVSFTSSGSRTPLTSLSTPLLPARLPSIRAEVPSRPFTEDSSHVPHTAPSVQPGYKPRVRKVHTKEIAPDDIHAVVTLGMAPFMIGQDSMSNQNRLVRNEALLTQHVLRLQRSLSQSESTHAKREEDIYRILQEHKASINNISVADKNTDAGDSAGAAPTSASLFTNPDFTALLEAQVDIRSRLDHLMADVTATTLSTRLTLEDLDERIRQLSSKVLTHVPPTPTPTPTLPVHGMPPPRFTQTKRSGVSPERGHRKRKRAERIASVSPPPRAGSMYEHRFSPHHHHSRGRWTEAPRDDASVDVIYGPISTPYRGGGGSSSNYAGAEDDDDDDDHRDNWSPPRIRTIATEALRDVGLSPRTIHSVRRAHDPPDFISIRFLKYEHAARFVDLVHMGRDRHSDRHARLAEPPSVWNTESCLEESAASGSNTTMTFWE